MDATATSLMARLRQSPLDPGTLEALRAYCDDRADFATWVEALELHARAMAEAELDPAEIGRLHLSIGHLWRDQLRRADRALVHYRAALDFDAAQRPAMAAARAIYAEAGRWDQVAKLLSREAESLPEGTKRAGLLGELGFVYGEQLGDKQSALQVLREAVAYAANDLHLRHQLATTLLDLADRERDGRRSAELRNEAADELCAMAKAVSDDYALAYLEAALDAVAHHPQALSLLDHVAPRLGRQDALAPRWVAAIQSAPDLPSNREVRLKLARAYLSAGQAEDARACLSPLLARNDAEAAALLSQGPTEGRSSTAARADDTRNTRKASARDTRPPVSQSRPPASESRPPVAASQPPPKETRPSLKDSRAPVAREPSSALDGLAMLARADQESEQQAALEAQAHEEPLTLEPEEELEAEALVDERSVRTAQPEEVELLDDEPDELEATTGTAIQVPAERAAAPIGGEKHTTDLGLLSAERDLDTAELAELLEGSDLETTEEHKNLLGDAVTASTEQTLLEAAQHTVEALPASDLETTDEHAALSADGQVHAPASRAPEQEHTHAPRAGAALLAQEPALPSEEDEERTLDHSELLDYGHAGATPLELGDEDRPAEAAPVDATLLELADDDGPAEAAPAEGGLGETKTRPAAVMSVPSDDPPSARRAIAQALESLPQDPEDEFERDLGGEVTQPRASLEIPAEARAEAVERDRMASTPHVPIRMPLSERANAAENAAPPEPVEPPDELSRLRKELERKLRFRDRRGAAEIAEAILKLDGTDRDALSALQEHLRATRDFRRLRELSLRIGEEAGLPVEVRVAHLREAAMLSESKLGDPNSAYGALRSLLALEPADREAFDRLRQAYQRGERWDELQALLSARVDHSEDASERASLMREVGALARDRLGQPERAIEAFQRVLQWAATPADEAALSELLLSEGRLSEAAKLLEARLSRSDEPELRIPILRTLAELYEDKLSDLERAYETSEMLLAMAPGDAGALDRLERIDTRCQRFDRLLTTLETRLPGRPEHERPEALLRIAELALEQLHDLAAAVDACRRAFELAPGERSLWPRISQVYDDAQRPQEFVALLWESASAAQDPALKTALLREVATRRQRAGDERSALEAYEALLEHVSDPDALDVVVSLLRRTDRHADLARRLDELAAQSEAADAHALRMERAGLLAGPLQDPAGAIAELERVLDQLAPRDVRALEQLIALAAQTGDAARKARYQEQLLPLLGSADARAELASALADAYEGPLANPEAALRVVQTWTRTDPMNPQPYLRSLPLLTRLDRRSELLAVYDRLASLAMADDEIGEFALRAARSAIELSDYEGAWLRLVPRVVEAHDPVAEALLRELAQLAKRAEQLAELYVGLAQRSSDAKQEQRRWLDASQVYEVMLGAYDKALEAHLRAFAKDLDDSSMLDEAERLTQLAAAWPRLAQVYDTLVRRAEGVDARIKLLMRHAHLLEEDAGDAVQAFERVSVAFQLDPSREETYAEARRLALLAERGDALLALHERRALSAASPLAKIDALLECCSIAQHVLAEPAQAMGYLARAVNLAGPDTELLEKIEQRAEQLDRAEPPLDGRGILFSVAETYKLRTEEARRDEPLVALLSMRAAHLFEAQLGNVEAAYRTLERASALVPSHDELLNTLVHVAERAKRLPELAEHLQRIADDAIDSASASAALRRLGGLCEGPLAAPGRAADVYKQLVILRPRDVDASDRLRAALAAAGRHKDLLGAIDRHLMLVASEQDKLPLLKQAALTWENGLRNRFEARDAWRKVLSLAPEDAEALAALERLAQRSSIDDAALLESDVVVLPEDLHPSIPPEEPASPPAEPAGATVSVAPTALEFVDGQPQGGSISDSGAPGETASAEPTAEPSLPSEPASATPAVPPAGADPAPEVASPDSANEAAEPLLTEAADTAAGVELTPAADPAEAIAATPADEIDEPWEDAEADAVEEIGPDGRAPMDADTDPSELAFGNVTESPAPGPFSTWAETEPRLRAASSVPSALLLELASLDARQEEAAEPEAEELAESGTLELEGSVDESEVVPMDLDSLSSMVSREPGRAPRTQTRVPPPPPARSVPPAPPAAAASSVPPPLPGSRGPSMPPSPSRRD